MKEFNQEWLENQLLAGKIRGFTDRLISLNKTKNPKYGNRQVIIDGIKFASKKEGARYLVLKMMETAGLISDLKLQVPFLLIEKNKTERSCKYLADFVYTDLSRKDHSVQVIEDAKSAATRKIKTYIIKRKLMLEIFGIKILET